MARMIFIDGVTREMTPAEEAAFDAHQATIQAEAAAVQAEKSPVDKLIETLLSNGTIQPGDI